MTQAMTSIDPDPGAPPLLLAAAVARPPHARAAWAAWSAARDIEDISWDELRLLGVVAARRRALAIDDELGPRLDGIRRFIWSSTQFRIAGAMPILRRLAERGVPFCLLKGAALLTGGHLLAGERFMRDVDLLFRREHLAEAVDVLLTMGWRTERIASRQEIFSLAFPRLHALGFESRNDPEHAIDLHLSALPLNRFLRSDEALWGRTRETRLFGVPVRVPAAEDLMCLTLAHSYLSDREQGHDWAVDAAALARGADFDWELLFVEAHRRGIELMVLGRLRQLLALGAISIPRAATEWLDRIHPEPIFWRELESLARRTATGRVPASPTAPACSSVRARRLLSHVGEEKAPPLPEPLPWLRWDVPLPQQMPQPATGGEVRIRGRIRHAASLKPIRFRVYYGSSCLAGGHTIPIPLWGHRFDVRLRLDPAVVAAEGEASLSFYFGRRSRDAGVLVPRSKLSLTRIEVG